MTTSASFIDQKIDVAAQFKAHVTEEISRTYFSYGKIDAWPDESSPNSAIATVSTMYDVWNNMIGGEVVSGADLQHVIPRYNWTTNTTYFAYDDKNPQMNDGNVKFYVVTSDYNVYKCIANNFGSNSTSMPTAVNPDATTLTPDGYVWKYMYTVSDNDKLRFMTNEYLPVKTLTGDDGSRQWAVQSASIEGGIEAILLITGGENYNSAPTITITGDGVGASATATINTISNTVNNIIVTAVGQSYSFANVTFSGNGGSNAEARVIISPFGGHGSDPLFELGGRNLILNKRLTDTEEDILPVSNKYRQIALIKTPKIANTTNIFSNTVFFQGYTISVNPTGSGDYEENELLYQGTDISSATFRGNILTWNAATSVITTINNTGTLSSGLLIGANSGVSRELTSFETGALEPYSGKVLYTDNIKPITRNIDQTEDFKIIIKF